jgi:D-alanine-D-alanine ligase
MEQLDSEVPLPKRSLAVGIVYNLKKGLKAEVPDAEAELDNIDTVHAIQSALEAKGHKTVLLEADEALPEKLRHVKIDIAFNIAEGLHGRGREAQVPAMLRFFGIPHTGSDETTLCIALDKALTKRILSSCKIRTPKSALLSSKAPMAAGSLQYPVIIKPNAEGSSKGISDISIVKTKNELRELAKRNISLYQQDMLAEEYIEGREFTVGILGNGSEAKIFPPMEILYKKETQEDYHVYSYNIKQNYKEYIEYQCPAALTNEQETEMMDISRKIYNILGCLDFARIDFRMSKEGKIYFIEINPLPGLAPGYSDYPMLAEFCGVSYTDLINAVLDAAMKRLSAGNRGEAAL